jgi:outer membrane lipoprotein-sorting protein
MKPFRIALSAALFVASALPAAAEKLSMAEISAYLNALKSAQTRFVQVNADGSQSTGTVFIKRPGRARFEYDPPVEALVMAGGQQVAIFDPKSNSGPTQYPLKRTPLNLILARRIDLGTARMVVGHGEQDGMTTITAQDPKNPEYGTIRLFFSHEPITLRQWVITDGAGDQTKVILGDLDRDVEFGSAMFSIPMEIRDRYGE